SSASWQIEALRCTRAMLSGAQAGSRAGGAHARQLKSTRRGAVPASTEPAREASEPGQRMKLAGSLFEFARELHRAVINNNRAVWLELPAAAIQRRMPK